jgi:hypothetical protein
MRECQAEAYGCAVVEDVDPVLFETDRLGELVDQRGQMFKRIAKALSFGRI